MHWCPSSIRTIVERGRHAAASTGERHRHAQRHPPPGRPDDPLKRPPRPPAEPAVVVTGAVEHELRIPSHEAVRPARRVEVVADFHCVTTWTARGLRWSGLPFRSFWHEVLAPASRPAAGARCIVAEGLDGTRAVLLLEDALAPDVVLADRLDGEPLTLAHGAPLRLVSPRQYGYKSIEHLHRIEVHLTPPPSAYGPEEHLRARVDLEERHSSIGPRVLRVAYRPLVPLTAAVSAWSLRRGPR